MHKMQILNSYMHLVWFIDLHSSLWWFPLSSHCSRRSVWFFCEFDYSRCFFFFLIFGFVQSSISSSYNRRMVGSSFGSNVLLLLFSIVTLKFILLLCINFSLIYSSFLDVYFLVEKSTNFVGVTVNFVPNILHFYQFDPLLFL